MTDTCRYTLSRLGDLADDALAPADLARLRAHFARCPACTRFAAGYRAVPRVARLATDARAPSAAVDRALRAARGDG
jgi:hypothetical protein